MLSSIILSMAMSVSPAQATDIPSLDTQSISAKHEYKQLDNINNSKTKVTENKLSDNQWELNSQTVGSKRGSKRF